MAKPAAAKDFGIGHDNGVNVTGTSDGAPNSSWVMGCSHVWTGRGQEFSGRPQCVSTPGQGKSTRQGMAMGESMSCTSGEYSSLVWLAGC